MLKHYRVKQGINCWHIYDNEKGETVKTVPIRKEARRIVNGLNGGWINLLKEEGHETEVRD